MDNDGKGILGDPEATGEEVRQAWEFAALAAMHDHVASGEPVVTWDWETNQVLLVPPDEFTVPEVTSRAGETSRNIGE